MSVSFMSMIAGMMRNDAKNAQRGWALEALQNDGFVTQHKNMIIEHFA